MSNNLTRHCYPRLGTPQFSAGSSSPWERFAVVVNFLFGSFSFVNSVNSVSNASV